jgi:thiol:disulfide interchange protein DsbC
MTMTISKLRNALGLCLLGANLALPLPASAQTAAPTANSIAERLQSLYPATRFGAVNTTPWPGVFEVVMGANLAYVDESGQYFLFGHLFDMKAQRDLTAERKDAQTRVDFAALPLADAVKDVRGNGARTLAIFSDPDCPYCLKLETEIKSLTDVTIYTFLMPIASLHPGARSKAIAVWCSRDRVAAWRALMLRDMTNEPGQGMSAPRRSQHCTRRAPRHFGDADPGRRRRSHSSRRRQQCADRGVARARHGQRRRPSDQRKRRAMNRTALTPLLLMALTLAGCASTLSGVGGADGYACKAPEGAMCTSVSGIYANSAQGMPKPAKPSAQKPPPDEPVAYGATPWHPAGPPPRRVRCDRTRDSCGCGSPPGKTRTAICTNRHWCMSSSIADAGSSSTCGRRRAPAWTAWHRRCPSLKSLRRRKHRPKHRKPRLATRCRPRIRHPAPSPSPRSTESCFAP